VRYIASAAKKFRFFQVKSAPWAELRS